MQNSKTTIRSQPAEVKWTDNLMWIHLTLWCDLLVPVWTLPLLKTWWLQWRPPVHQQVEQEQGSKVQFCTCESLQSKDDFCWCLGFLLVHNEVHVAGFRTELHHTSLWSPRSSQSVMYYVVEMWKDILYGWLFSYWFFWTWMALPSLTGLILYRQQIYTPFCLYYTVFRAERTYRHTWVSQYFLSPYCINTVLIFFINISHAEICGSF